jgi:UDP-N-acetylglucosamine 2-epimerase (non-hydrolysing)
MKSLLIVFGTRPEYLKLKPLVKVFQSHGVPFCFLQVLQHETLVIEEERESFYQKVSLSSDPTRQRLTNLAASISNAVEPFVRSSSAVFIQGDTATAFFTAISAFHFQIPIYHVEAGLRTFDLANPFPEEGYRSMISRIATYHLCPDEAAKTTLIREGITQNLFVVGNTILDLVRSYEMKVKPGTLVPITIHRRENWENLPQIVQAIHSLAETRTDLQFLWIFHPNPSLKEIVQTTLNCMSPLDNLRCEDPCSHKQLCEYIHSAYCLITDSGGIQEEASFLGKYCFVIRKTTERSSIPSDYICTLDSVSSLKKQFLQKEIQPLPPCTVYGNGFAANTIYTHLQPF